MPPFPAPEPTWQSRLEPVFRLYAGLLKGCDPEVGLGGRLLWAGELGENGCNLMRAANIAGAASLGATADSGAMRYANRDGVADFLVNSLDEALRILKNEVRKGQAVSVGMSVEPAAAIAGMLERGVLPDLLPPAEWRDAGEMAWFLAHGSQRVEVDSRLEGWTFRAWAPAPPNFDMLAASALPADDYLNRRWLRLSPRYLGLAARQVRSFACTHDVQVRLAETWAGDG